MASLPAEIITHEIFSKLPVKSLLRFKCVSKSFCASISSPQFAKIHVRESRSSDANRFLIVVCKYGRNLYSVDIDSPDDSVTTIPIPCTVYPSKPVKVSIVGSIDGLICVVLGPGRGSYSQAKYIIVNPSTRVFREIPYARTPPVSFSGKIFSSVGFGFDDLTDDYKLVRVTDIHVERFDRPERDTYREVMVYSLNQRTWKLVERVEDPIDSLMLGQNGVLIKNHLLHWMFTDSNGCRIGCFDTRTDKWIRDVPLMMYLFEGFEHNNEFNVTSIGVINECLCLFTATMLASSGPEIVWILKEYEGKESWVKLFHIPSILSSNLFQFTEPFFCFPRESKYEVLAANYDREGVFLFDIVPTNGEIDKIKSVKRIPAFVGGCLFTESLVQI